MATGTPTQPRSDTRSLTAWAALVVLTGLSWWLGSDHGFRSAPAWTVSAAILVLAYAKAGLIGSSFMELHRAARWLRSLFLGWCVLSCLIVGALYVSSGLSGGGG